MLRTWPGPYNRISSQDLAFLHRAYGFPIEYKTLTLTAKAAQLRVYHWDNHAAGGGRIGARAARLRALWDTRLGLRRLQQHWDWHHDCSLQVLCGNEEDVRLTTAATAGRIERHLSGHAPRPWDRATFQRVHCGFQREATRRLKEIDTLDAEEQLRRKLGNYGLPDRRQAARCLGRLRRLGNTVPPRVWPARFAFLCNRWSTNRNRQVAHRRCLMGCSWGDDSCAHYARCPHVWCLLNQILHVHARISDALELWCLAAPPDVDTERDPNYWQRLALGQYAALRTTNALRHGRTPAAQDLQDVVLRSFRAGVAEGLRGCGCRWATDIVC